MFLFQVAWGSYDKAEKTTNVKPAVSVKTTNEALDIAFTSRSPKQMAQTLEDNNYKILNKSSGYTTNDVRIEAEKNGQIHVFDSGSRNLTVFIDGNKVCEQKESSKTTATVNYQNQTSTMEVYNDGSARVDMTRTDVSPSYDIVSGTIKYSVDGKSIENIAKKKDGTTETLTVPNTPEGRQEAQKFWNDRGFNVDMELMNKWIQQQLQRMSSSTGASSTEDRVAMPEQTNRLNETQKIFGDITQKSEENATKKV